MSQHPAPVQPSNRPKRRTWSIRAITILLTLQAAGIAYFSLDLLAQQSWEIINGVPIIEPKSLTPGQLAAVETAIFFIPLAVYAVFAALGFFFLLRLGWLLAMIMQGLTLATCLFLYFRDGPNFVYLVMLYCILMVLYLNSFDVRVLFDTPDSTPGAAL